MIHCLVRGRWCACADLLSSIMEFRVSDLKSYFPKTWTDSDEYEKKLYVLVTLTETDSDYEKIYQLFTEKVPKKIERVQQPIAYLRYTVQSEYLTEMNISYTEGRKYIEIDESKIDLCLKYNCDERYMDGSLIRFQSFPPQDGSKPVVIINKRECSITSEKNHYPTYIVHF